MLYLETRGHAIRPVGGADAGPAAGQDNTETFGVEGIGRTPQPNGSIVRCFMHILNLAVPRRVITILFKIVWFL